MDSRTLDVDDFANITDLKADDYVLVTAVNNKGRYEVKSIDKAEVVTGTVEGYKFDSNVTMGGTKYEYSATADNIKKTSYNVGREASLVLDSYGYVIAVDESVVLSDYVYIAEFGSCLLFCRFFPDLFNHFLQYRFFEDRSKGSFAKTPENRSSRSWGPSSPRPG